MEEKKSFSWENGDVAELANGERAKVVFDAPVKMTLSEVCEVLGKNIVIVKED